MHCFLHGVRTLTVVTKLRSATACKMTSMASIRNHLPSKSTWICGRRIAYCRWPFPTIYRDIAAVVRAPSHREQAAFFIVSHLRYRGLRALKNAVRAEVQFCRVRSSCTLCTLCDALVVNIACGNHYSSRFSATAWPSSAMRQALSREASCLPTSH